MEWIFDYVAIIFFAMYILAVKNMKIRRPPDFKSNSSTVAAPHMFYNFHLQIKKRQT